MSGAGRLDVKISEINTHISNLETLAAKLNSTALSDSSYAIGTLKTNLNVAISDLKIAKGVIDKKNALRKSIR